jgi:uncharacterized membrane protein
MRALFYLMLIAAAIWFVTRVQKNHRKTSELEKELSLLRRDLEELRNSLENPAEKTGQTPYVIPVSDESRWRSSSAEPSVEAPVEEVYAPADYEEVLSAHELKAGEILEEPLREEFEREGKSHVKRAEPVRPVSLEKAAPSIDWERWIGVRGAALLGGIVLAIAGLLFLRYSIERGLIPPVMRVTLSVAAGIGCIAGSEYLRKREYTATANSLAGAGFVLLYGAFWAARALYGLIGTPLAFGLIALVTTSCGVFSWRRRSLVIASIGLAGGFLAPYMLSTNRDNPLGLFGYLLILDLGVLLLARARRWPLLAAACLAATAVYQFAWIFYRMGPERTVLGLVILGVFFLLFRFSRKYLEIDSSSETGTIIDAVTVLVPCALSLYFAVQTQAEPHLYPLGALLLMVMLAAMMMARVHEIPLFGLVGGFAAVVNVLVWMAKTDLTPALAWESFAVMAVMALGAQAVFEFRRASGEGSKYPPLVVAAGFAAGHFLLVPKEPASLFWPWILGVILLCAIVFRLGLVTGKRAMLPASTAAAALAFSQYYLANGGPGGELTFFYGLAVGLTVLLQAVSIFGLSEENRKWALTSAGVAPLVLLASFLFSSKDPALWPMTFFGATTLLGILAALAFTRNASGKGYFATAALVAGVHAVWSLDSPLPVQSDALTGLIVQGVCAAVFTLWPFVVGKHLLERPFARYGAALAAPLMFLPMKSLFVICYGKTAIGALPLALGSLSLFAAYRARKLFEDDPVERRNNLAWFVGAALAFISVAIPLQLSNEWVTVGWALEGFAVIFLWSHIDHPGLRFFGLALLMTVTVRLVANPSILEYHPRDYLPVLNWLLYTYGISAAALLGSYHFLRPLEVERRSLFEKGFYDGRYPIGAIACSLAALLVIFVWINLTIFDAFSSHSTLSISMDRQPARDLTLSLSWVVYALVLLTIGVARRIGGLRWASLALLLVTITKVFMYDLGALKDLYRVASLVGLAVSLISVSLAYQRFVFRKVPQEEAR